MHSKHAKELSLFIRHNRNTEFKWGSFDCCTTVAKVIEIQTGKDLFEPYRGKYKTEKGAAKAQKDIGSIESALDEHFDRIDPKLMQRGDVCMFEGGMMGFSFSGRSIGTTEKGVRPVREKIAIAWRV